MVKHYKSYFGKKLCAEALRLLNSHIKSNKSQSIIKKIITAIETEDEKTLLEMGNKVLRSRDPELLPKTVSALKSVNFSFGAPFALEKGEKASLLTLTLFNQRLRDILIKEKINFNSIFENGHTLLTKAVATFPIQLYIWLINGKPLKIDINAFNRFGFNALYHAIQTKDLDAVHILVRHGAGAYMGNNLYAQEVAISSGNYDIIDYLILKFGTNSHKELSSNLMYLACQLGDVSVIELLLSNQVNPNNVDSHGNNALLLSLIHKK